MPKLSYNEAFRRGQKEFRACTSRGEYPYLPVLEDFVPRDRLNRGVDLGQLQIPVEAASLPELEIYAPEDFFFIEGLFQALYR